MNSVLAVYDLPEALKIANPSVKLRRYGVRVNMSCWVFPAGMVPTDILEKLRRQGATVHLIEFSEQSQEKVLDLARAELKRHCKKVVEMAQEKCLDMRSRLAIIDSLNLGSEYDKVSEKDKAYKKWRSVLSRARRELIASESCAFGFEITRDVQEALDSLKHVLEAELSAALAWKESQKREESHAVSA